MWDCISSPLPPCSGIKIKKLGLICRSWTPRNDPSRDFDPSFCSTPSIVAYIDSKGLFKNSSATKSKNSVKSSRNLGVVGSEDREPISNFGNKEAKETIFGPKTDQFDAVQEKKESGGVEFLKRGKGRSSKEDVDEFMALAKGSDAGESVQASKGRSLRSGRQIMRRSSILAKQVISVRSALSLGFVSQLWVDTSAWTVLAVEVRPNLLSGESERFLLENVDKVGDVVLIHDENVEYDFKMVGLETLVGYNVETRGRHTVGKVRGYDFNISSGALRALELDSFGMSIIPSSLVSTYALLVEDVLEVVSDTVIVHEAAVSRLQRLTKGFWNSQHIGFPIDDTEESSELDKQPAQINHRQSTRGSRHNRKCRRKVREVEDKWELPMDYL